MAIAQSGRGGHGRYHGPRMDVLRVLSRERDYGQWKTEMNRGNTVLSASRSHDAKITTDTHTYKSRVDGGAQGAHWRSHFLPSGVPPSRLPGETAGVERATASSVETYNAFQS